MSQDSGLEAEDKLFATLDTTAHGGKLPSGLNLIFIDTVGFISDLPHELVESFSTTLDDVKTAVSSLNSLLLFLIFSHSLRLFENLVGRVHPRSYSGGNISIDEDKRTCEKLNALLLKSMCTHACMHAHSQVICVKSDETMVTVFSGCLCILSVCLLYQNMSNHLF